MGVLSANSRAECLQANASNGTIGFPRSTTSESRADAYACKLESGHSTDADPPKRDFVSDDSESETELPSARSSESSFKSDWEDLDFEIRCKAQQIIASPRCASQFRFEKTLEEAPRNHGRVDLMIALREGCFVAVKKMPNSWVTSGPEAFEAKYEKATERPWFDVGVVKFLQDVGYEHVCKPFGIFFDEGFTCVVNEYADEGDLFSWLESGLVPGPEREASWRPLMRQLFMATSQLHDIGVAHRDISAENILITRGEHGLSIKLIDFGMATVSRSCKDLCGKPSYMAPELFSGTPSDPFLCDVFSLGVVLFAVCLRDYPWNTTAPLECDLFGYVKTSGFRNCMQKRRMINENCSGRMQRFAQVMSMPLMILLEGLLEIGPCERLTLGEECWLQPDSRARPSALDAQWLQQCN